MQQKVWKTLVPPPPPPPIIHMLHETHILQGSPMSNQTLCSFVPTLTSKIVFLTSLRICRFFSNVASISNKLLTTSGPRTPWKQGRGLFSPSYILAKWICPSHTCRIHTFIKNFKMGSFYCTRLVIRTEGINKLLITFSVVL